MNTHGGSFEIAFSVILLLGACQVSTHAADLDITIGEPWTISSSATAEGTHLFPALYRLQDGTLLLDYHVQNDIDFAKRVCLRSMDNGKTWTLDPQRVNREDALGQLKDGTVLGYDMYTQEIAPGATEFKGKMFRSTDGGNTFTGPIEITMHMPRACKDPNPNRNLNGMLFWRSILELPDGGLLACMYGTWAGERKYAIVAVRSDDRGVTWNYLSTIAFAPDVGTEGFCEPVMSWTKAGDILCMMRVGSGRGQPMYQARSTNYGKTWSGPKNVGVESVDPDLVLMSNGVLACSYGRPGCWIMFDSTGTGRQWEKPIQVFDGASTCYTAIREIEPGKLLYVYDALNFDDGSGHGPANCLRAVEIEVERP